MEELIRPSYVREHQRVLDTALGLPLPDAVFAVIHYNLLLRRTGPPPYCEEIPLTALAKLGTPSELDTWRSRALALRQSAYPVGEALLRNKEQYGAARDQWIADHPGFNDKSYEVAISYGCFQAR